MWDRNRVKYRQGTIPPLIQGAGMGDRSNRKPLSSPAECWRHRSRDLMMQSMRAALSYLWRAGERNEKEKLPAAGSCHLPTAPDTHRSTLLTQPGVRMGWLRSLSTQWGSWLQGSGTCRGQWHGRLALRGHPLFEQVALQDC